jgi:hypothetical protein
MNTKRTNRINLSLTDKEFNDLQDFSREIGKPIAKAARELIQTSFFIGKMYGEFEKYYRDKHQKSKNIKDDFNFVMIEIYQSLNDRDSLEYFKHERILTILKFIEQNKYWINLDKKINQ